MSSAQFVELGKVVGVWGVKGWLKLHSYTRERADIAHYSNWWLANDKSGQQAEAVEVINCRLQGAGVVAQLVGIDGRDAAADLIGKIILVKSSELPKLSKDQFYWQQLIGLKVVNTQLKNSEIGLVESILETGANDVLVVKNAVTGGADVLIPYIKEVVLEVDLEQGFLLVDWDPSNLTE
jgi:16S rRNA processing protein RimM